MIFEDKRYSFAQKSVFTKVGQSVVTCPASVWFMEQDTVTAYLYSSDPPLHMDTQTLWQRSHNLFVWPEVWSNG